MVMVMVMVMVWGDLLFSLLKVLRLFNYLLAVCRLID